MKADPIPFEIHITVGTLPDRQEGLFKAICQELEGKPLLIELARGDHWQQPMFSRVVMAESMEEALHLAGHYSARLTAKHFEPQRLKIEVPVEHAPAFEAQGQAGDSRYYEWHGKVSYEHVESLLKLCEAHRVHLSRNALKDEQHLRFITLREPGSASEFQYRVKALTEALQGEDRVVSKQHFEYCVLDTNVYLDTGWLISSFTS